MVFLRRMTSEVTFTVDLGSPKNIYARPLTTSIISKKIKCLGFLVSEEFAEWHTQQELSDAKQEIKALKHETGKKDSEIKDLLKQLSNEQDGTKMIEANKDQDISKLKAELLHNEGLLDDSKHVRTSLQNELDQTTKENAKLLNAIETSDHELSKMHKQLDQTNLELQDLTKKYIETQEQRYQMK